MPLLLKTDTGWSASPDKPEPWITQDEGGQSRILLANDTEPDQSLLNATSIAIEFPAFNDGRGLSLAVLLRTRLGYEGQLCAIGAIHEDVLHYIARCGFDAVDLPDERDVDIALALLKPYAQHYQGSVEDPQPAYRRVSRGVSA